MHKPDPYPDGGWPDYLNLENSSNSSTEEGNTKPPPKKQISPAKRWCFTWNNFPKDWEKILVPKICGKYSIGIEKGESGTPHLQGYIEFNHKVRALSEIGIKEIHWEKSRGNKLHNLKYTQKDGVYIQNFKKEYKCKIEDMYDWQKDICNVLAKDPDDRSIYWFWEKEGCAGKTTFQKYVFTHFEDCVVLSGKGSDMKNGIVQYQNLNDKLPRIVLINIPRSNKNYISWSGIEEIKDMMFFSGKYEGGMVCGENPHVICFANNPPEKDPETDEYYVSEDRLKIIKIDK